MRSLIKVLLLVVVCGIFAFALVNGQSADKTPTMDGKNLQTATFAGGCFWCMEPPFEQLAGVLSVTAGYTGGQDPDPTYREVSSGDTGHAEAVQIVFDPAKVTFAALLEVFWKNIDPTTPNRQFCDVGSQYRAAIFYHNPEQQHLAEEAKKALQHSGTLTQPIVTEIVSASAFYPAEDYHQDYYKKNPVRYKLYRYNCGRDQVLEKLWGKQ